MEGWRQRRLGRTGTNSRKEENESVPCINRPSEKRVKTGDAGGQPNWRSSLLGDPGVKFFYGKLGEQKKGKEERNGLTLTGLLMEGFEDSFRVARDAGRIHGISCVGCQESFGMCGSSGVGALRRARITSGDAKEETDAPRGDPDSRSGDSECVRSSATKRFDLPGSTYRCDFFCPLSQ